MTVDSRSVEKPVPSDVDAEEAVLGSLLIDPEAITSVSTVLETGDFYREKNGWIYEACLAIGDRSEAINQITVAHELARQNRLEAVGGVAYLSQLVAMVPTSVHAVDYAELVQRTALMRRLISAGGQIAAIGYESPADVDAALARAEEILFLLRHRRSVADFVHIREVLDQYFEESGFLPKTADGEIPHIATHLIEMDKLLGGFQRSDLLILAARPSVGKSSLAMSIARNAAVDQGAHVGIFSLEMSKEQLVQRLLAAEANVDSHRLRLDQLNPLERQRVMEKTGVLAEAPIYINDSPLIRITEMMSKCRRLQQERGVDLVIIDYLQLIQGSGSRGDNRVQEISEISRALKGMARELKVPVLALSQLSRAVEARSPKIPMLSDLRESGCLAGDTPVYLPESGAYCCIRDLVGKQNVRVLALNTDTWKLESRALVRAFSTGRKLTYRLTTRLGRTMRATANHQFLTVHGWQPLESLEPHMRIALPRCLPGPHQPTMSRAELALLAHLIGDGCTLARHIIQYTTADLDIAETVAALASELFGGAVSPRISKERGWYQVYLAAGYRLTHGVRNPIASWLDQLGVFDLRSYEKRIPQQVFAQTAEGIAHFLRHLWSTDGSINPPRGDAPRVFYASSSLELARGVQTLLLRLGINAVLLRTPQVGRGRDQFHVDVSGKPDLNRFVQQVGAIGERKTESLSAVATYLEGRRANTNRDVLPRETWRLLVTPALQVSGITTRQMQADLGMQYCGTTLYKHSLGRERACRVAKVVRCEQLARLAQSDVYWDEITTIEPTGEEDVYDLTVEGLHNFVAGNMIVHNSIEQDADVVMFIYREDVYTSEDEWEKHNPGQPYPKGIADIIVAKHRNGPTGRFSLLFFEKTTKFGNLENDREQDY